MNLYAAIELFGGGPGSGCHGENCGRPSGSGTVHDQSTVAESSRFQKVNGIRTLTYQGHKIELHPDPIGKQFHVVVQGNIIATYASKNEAKVAVKADPGKYISKTSTRGFVPPLSPKPEKESEPKKGSSVNAKFASEENVRAAFGKATATDSMARLHPTVGPAIRALALGQIDVRLLKIPFSLTMHKFEKNSNVNGDYNPTSNTIRLNNQYALDSRTLLHEFGHMIDRSVYGASRFQVNFGTRQGRPPDSIGAPPLSAYGKSNLFRDRDAADEEFLTARRAVWKADMPGQDFDWQNAGRKTLDVAVSKYSLHNRKEWFAEAFATYYNRGAYRSNLEKVAPQTFKLIERLTTGKYFD